MNNFIEQNIVDTIRMIVENYIKKAEFDKTIIAYINYCIDKDLGLYSISYQGANYEAYAIPGLVIKDGAQVYVLKPQNNIDYNMFIIGSTNGAEIAIGENGELFYTKDEIDKLINELYDEIQNKQETYVAGDNIIIEDNVISAIDTIYDDTVIKEQIENKQDALILGDNLFWDDEGKINAITGGVGKLEHSLTIGNQVFDGTQDVYVPVYDGSMENEIIMMSLLNEDSSQMTMSSIPTVMTMAINDKIDNKTTDTQQLLMSINDKYQMS